jgi:hypothetical protein
MLGASGAVCLAVEAEKTKHAVIFHQQNARQNHNLMILHNFIANMVKLKYS